eukprot:10877216-Alexandrium_andersonii.AAC.1
MEHPKGTATKACRTCTAQPNSVHNLLETLENTFQDFQPSPKLFCAFAAVPFGSPEASACARVPEACLLYTSDAADDM